MEAANAVQLVFGSYSYLQFRLANEVGIAINCRLVGGDPKISKVCAAKKALSD